MATQRSGHRPAGGLHSRNVRHTSNPKSEPRPHAKNPGGVSQYGQSQGTHITHSTESNYRGDPVNVGRGYQNPVGPTSFNNIGPGKGRTVYSSGSQGVQGSVNPGNAPAKNTDILSQFGPDYRKP